MLVLSRARTMRDPAVQAHQLFVEFIDNTDLARMDFFEATYLSVADPIPVFLAVDFHALHIYDQETHDKLALHPLHSVHSWTVDAARSRLEFLVAWGNDKHLLVFTSKQALAIISLVRYHIARALEHIL